MASLPMGSEFKITILANLFDWTILEQIRIYCTHLVFKCPSFPCFLNFENRMSNHVNAYGIRFSRRQISICNRYIHENTLFVNFKTDYVTISKISTVVNIVK